MKIVLLLSLLLALSVPVGWGQSQQLIATGSYHGCSGTSVQIKCWGDNSAGELGDGTTTDRFAPVAVKNLPTPILEVGASYDRSCALVSGAKVYCWGRHAKYDSSGKPVASVTPVAVSGAPSGAHGLSVGVTHVCLIDGAGQSWCEGMNDRGQIGDGTTTLRKSFVMTKGGAVTYQVSASDGYTCVLKDTARVKCWGRSHGTDGDPTNPEGLVVNSVVPVVVLEGASQISMTGDFAAAVLADGAVATWGENDHGQLGDGTTVGRSIAAVVVGLPPSAQVVATANHACALASGDGSVRCWGRGDHGQMGDGTVEDRHLVGAVVQASAVSRLYGAASGHWTVAVLADGSVVGWGRNDKGNLLDGTVNDHPTPIALALP